MEILNSRYLYNTYALRPNRMQPLFGAIENTAFIRGGYTQEEIASMIEKNPKVKEILDKNSLSVNYNVEYLNNLLANHCTTTANLALKISRNLPPYLRLSLDTNTLMQAAYYHDFGKILIPQEILNKPNKLTRAEMEIVQLHTQLGYELLKTQGLSPKVLSLIKSHHDKPMKNPQEDLSYNLSSQIIKIADKYSALTESRSYKVAYSPSVAANILWNDVKNGEISPLVYSALIKTVKNF